MPELTGANTVIHGQWHHVVGVYCGTKLRLYFDGQLDAATETDGLLDVNTSPLLIGAVHAPWIHRWVGAIDDVAIYNYALTDKEVQELYTSRVKYHWLTVT